MDSNDQTVIETSRAKLVRLILAACASAAAGAWMLSQDAADIRYSRSFTIVYNSPAVVYGLGLAAILCFGACGLYGLWKTFDKRPGLVLNSSGLVDNASAVAAGFIPWADVAGAGIYQVQSQKMLVVRLRDPGKYIGRGNALRRALNGANSRMVGSPVSIPSATLKIEFGELVSLFDRYYQKYGGAPAEREG